MEQTHKVIHNIALAKKQRDAFRARLQNDLQKYCDKFGVTEFEAIHAIVDTVMVAIDNEAKNVGETRMPNSLAQTLLPQTKEMIDATEGVTPQSSSDPGGSFKPAWDISNDPYVLPPYAGTLTPENSLKAEKAVASPQKLDKDVTESDITAEIIHIKKSYKAHAAVLAEHQKLDDGYYYIGGASGYLSGSNNLIPEQSGYFYTIVRLLKSSPYLSADMVVKLGLKVPEKGFKFRKLKNKPIYKLQQYSNFETTNLSSPSPCIKNWIKKTKISEGMKKVLPSMSDGGAVEYLAVVGTTTGLLGSLVVKPEHSEAPVLYSYATATDYKNLPSGYMWIKNPLNNNCYVVKVQQGLLVPLEVAMASPAPPEYHWETSIAYSSKAVLIDNSWYGINADGTPVLTCPAAAFPPKPEFGEPGGPDDF